MATASEVMNYLRPNGGFVLVGDEYEGITFIEAEPFSKDEFLAAFEKCDAWKLEKKLQEQAKRQALLDKLGITEDEARLLLGGN